MILQSMGLSEMLIMCVIGLLGLAVPAAVLVFLYLIYNKLQKIEELLGKGRSEVK